MIKGDALDLHRDIFFLHSRFEILESSHQLPSAIWAHMMAAKPKQKWTTVIFVGNTIDINSIALFKDVFRYGRNTHYENLMK